MLRIALFVLFFLASLPCCRGFAELKLPSFFSDNMVLQRDKPIAIWGWSDPNSEVTVAFAGSSSTATADNKGNWKIQLPARKAIYDGLSLVVESGSERIEINNVLVGEVWLASGQSNMDFLLSRTHESEQDVSAANFPKIRMFLAARTPAAKPQSDIRGSWHVSTPQSAGSFSAVAYFFAKRIHEETGVPVGVLKSSWGGKRSECFTSREAMLSNEHGRKMVAELDRMAAQFNPNEEEKRYEKALARWKENTEEIRAFNKGKQKAERKRLPRQPNRAKPVYENERNPTVLFNGMIHPFVGYGIRGAIWYQGEANAKPELAAIYQEMFSLMIKDWRKRWEEDFPFYFVQLANFKDVTTDPGIESDWATVQNLQRRTLMLPGTGMATINDVGAARDIHPKNKKTVGNRLARWALKNQYQKDVVVSGPLYRAHRIDGDRVTIEFDHVGSGLKSRDGSPLKRFEITGDKKTWHWAEAKIVGNSVVVHCPDVPAPIAVRYAWAANPEGANLVNAEGLPASIFETTSGN